MIPYAGFDPEEGQKGYYQSVAEARLERRRERAYVMFKAGRDTMEIATALDVPEYRVLDWITTERCRIRRLPSVYEVPA